MQQQQPDLSIVVMQSQHPCSISQHILSPEVQVTHMPLGSISHLHMPMVRLQVHMAMPFIIMQQLTMPPAIMLQRFCIMVQAALSSQVQVIFMPPVHFSIFMVQRGIISHCAPVGMLIGAVMPGEAMPGMLMPVRSIIMLVIRKTPFL
jgi:hypothetical protein